MSGLAYAGAVGYPDAWGWMALCAVMCALEFGWWGKEPTRVGLATLEWWERRAVSAFVMLVCVLKFALRAVLFLPMFVYFLTRFCF